jgi:pimeloyl-ACP methyl ester carboxylesterase
MEHLHGDGGTIEYQVQGNGEPVLLIHVSLVADGLSRPLLARPELASRYQLIHYYRRGYMGSTLGHEPLTIALLASDAAALLRYLEVKAAHVAGHSIGGLIALQLAVDAPDLGHSLALLEPPLRGVPGGKASFERIILPMLKAYQSGDKPAALEIFCVATFGPDWQSLVEQAVPGGAQQALSAIDMFIQEQPAIQAWQFGSKEAGAIRQPVLSVLGARSSPIMKEGRTLLHTWFPQAEDLDVPTTHLLQMQDPKGVAQGLAEFFSRHAMALSPVV